MNMLPLTCTIISRTAGTATDAYGNVTSGTANSTVACDIQQGGIGARARAEPGEQGEFSVSEWSGFFPTGTVLDTGDAVSEPTLGTFEVVGRPWDANTGSAAVNHVEATLKAAT